ncbi:hypothetical protein PIROE2DRAFT_5352 [Piromyces sp. E2]|nr:hypothetical protein PIROE2DRAFT_5352 [Piromyces sp. E2]|eukprot:OUM67288.1 hypothetical protein PIROE2DRAFT_5352 [Piromyces sp. E2]
MEKLKAKPYQLHLSHHNFDPTLSNEQKAYYHYLRGYLYNIFDYYHHLAEKNLSMAIKLNPYLSEACNGRGGDGKGERGRREEENPQINNNTMDDYTNTNSNTNTNNKNKTNTKNKNKNKKVEDDFNKKGYQEKIDININSGNLELTLAKYCLEKALKLKPTDKVLNNMALTLRKSKTDYLEYQMNIKKSIDLSKKAINYNINNSTSWGNDTLQTILTY